MAKFSSASDHGRELTQHGYEVAGPIGAGAFSTVLRASVAETGVQVAVKSFDNVKCHKHASMALARDAELSVLQILRERAAPHPHIANMVQLLAGPASTHCILEYCSGGSLEWHLGKMKKKKREVAGRDEEGFLVYALCQAMDEEEVVPLAAQMASALLHLHGLECAHRDLKPGNVLFVDQSRTAVKICDFGFATRCADNRLKDRLGSLLYQAPELISCNTAGVTYIGKHVDMWALGALLFEMLHNQCAYHGVTQGDIENRIRTQGGHQEIDRELSSAARAVLHGLLTVAPSKRLRAGDLIDHPWLASQREHHAAWLELDRADKATGESSPNGSNHAADGGGGGGGGGSSLGPPTSIASFLRSTLPSPALRSATADEAARGGAAGSVDDWFAQFQKSMQLFDRPRDGAPRAGASGGGSSSHRPSDRAGAEAGHSRMSTERADDDDDDDDGEEEEDDEDGDEDGEDDDEAADDGGAYETEILRTAPEVPAGPEKAAAAVAAAVLPAVSVS